MKLKDCKQKREEKGQTNEMVNAKKSRRGKVNLVGSRVAGYAKPRTQLKKSGKKTRL